MHKNTCFFAVFLLFSLLSQLAVAQTPTPDIRPMLKSLTLAQKLQLLEYLRHLGADLDLEIQQSYEQVGRKEQFKTTQYIDALKPSKKQQRHTSVQWNPDTLLFDDLPEGTPLIDSFLVTNTGSEPYQIFSTKATCDCTVIKTPEYPVMPGETAVLRVEFDSSDKLGTATPAIIIYDNSWPNKRNILYLKGNVTVRKKPRKNPWDD